MLISESQPGTSKSVKALQLSLHMLDTKVFMQKKVLPTLRPSLRKLLVRLQEEHIKLASGIEWDDNGYRKPGWEPFDPLTWLASQLRTELNASAESATAAASAKGSNAKPDNRFDNMSRQEQSAELFGMMADEDGVLADIFSVIDSLADKNDQVNTHTAFQIIDSISPMTPGHLNESEFFTVVMRFVGDCTDEEFSAHCRDIYERIRLGSMSREDKIRLVFSIVDKDASQSLDLDEIFALGQLLNPSSNSIQQAKMTLMWLRDDDDDGSSAAVADAARDRTLGTAVSEGEFIRSMMKMTADMTNEQFNNGIHKIVRSFRDESPIDGTLEMTKELQAYAKALPTYQTARQKSVTFIKSLLEEEEDDILFIDVRSEPESTVSSLPCAIHMDVDEHGDVEENVREAVRKLELPPMNELKASTIVTFDTAGERGGIAAMAIENIIGLPVSNLCGGLIAWVNSGGTLVDLHSNPVKKLHPFNRDLEQFITSENQFILE